MSIMNHEEYHEVTGVYPDLALHGRGDWVTYAQQKLVETGLLEYHQIDGMFGEHTDQAVRHFQGMHGLAADGIVGQHTWAALDAVGAPPAGHDQSHDQSHDQTHDQTHDHAAAHDQHQGASGGHGGALGVLRFHSRPTIASSDGALVWTVYNAGPGLVQRGREAGHWTLFHDQQPIAYARDSVRTERDLRANEVHEEFGVGVKFETPDNGDYQAGVTLGEETHYVAYRVTNGQVHLLG